MEIASDRLSMPTTTPSGDSLLVDAARCRLQQLAQAIGDEGARRVLQSVLDDACAVLPILETCCEESVAVRLGDLSAADRLWFILNSTARPPAEELPEPMLDEMWGPARRESPTLIHGDFLLDLVVGAVRAADTPAEAETMLDALGRLLDPLFMAECAYHVFHAAAEGRRSPLRLLMAWRHWMERKASPPRTMDSPVGEVWRDHPELFDVSLWDHYDVSVVDKWKFVWGCLDSARRAMSEIDRFGPRYRIDAISNPYACPGVTIKITGRNFGPTGRVYFPIPESDDTAWTEGEVAGIDAVLWTDTEIDVVVPTWARPGELHLNAYQRVETLCLTRYIYRLGNKANFYGGLPSIADIRINGRNEGAWTGPNDNTMFGWSTSAGTLSIEVRNAEVPAAPRWRQDNLPGGVGSLVWRASTPIQPTKYIVAVTVSNGCGSVTREMPFLVTVPATLRIEGVEITQGIQTFSLDGGPSNTLPLVAHKDTILRVFVTANRGGWFGDQLSHFTAAVTIDGASFRPINGAPPGAMSGGNPFRDLGPLTSLRKRTTDASFNFRIPGAFCHGSKTFKVEVFGTDELGPRSTVEHEFHRTFVTNFALKVRYVRIGLPGRVTTKEEAERTLLRAFDMLPYPPTDLGAAWLDQWNTGQDVNTNEGRQALLGHLADQHSCTASEWLFPWEDDCPDDDGALWIGVIPADVGGKARVGSKTVIASGYDVSRRLQVIAAHELGHLLCLMHVNRGCGSQQPKKSTSCTGGNGYDSLPFGGQVMDIPFDPFNNTVVGWSYSDPNLMVFDFMSYGCIRWISATNWKRLIDGIYIPGGG